MNIGTIGHGVQRRIRRPLLLFTAVWTDVAELRRFDTRMPYGTSFNKCITS